MTLWNEKVWSGPAISVEHRVAFVRKVYLWLGAGFAVLVILLVLAFITAAQGLQSYL